MGLNDRESRLVDRVKDVEDQNRLLRRQLSISQNQLMSAITKVKSENKGRRLSSDGNDDYDANQNNAKDGDDFTNENEEQSDKSKQSSKCSVSFFVKLCILFNKLVPNMFCTQMYILT